MEASKIKSENVNFQYRVRGLTEAIINRSYLTASDIDFRNRIMNFLDYTDFTIADIEDAFCEDVNTYGADYNVGEAKRRIYKARCSFAKLKRLGHIIEIDKGVDRQKHYRLANPELIMDEDEMNPGEIG